MAFLLVYIEGKDNAIAGDGINTSNPTQYSFFTSVCVRRFTLPLHREMKSA
jgi:hypothetical protein